MRNLLALLIFCLAATAAHAASASNSVFVDDLTWTELRDALKAGSTTVIVPVGGSEQSGPHIAIGKHNVRVKALAARIASGLGNALVAPVLAYVPEGSINPPSGHMRYAGTVSIPDDVFRGVLEGAARSYRQHGFTDIVLIGDHGDYQRQLKAVAAKLNREWAVGTPSPARVHFIAAYYDIAQTTYVQALHAKGLSEAQIGSHAGVADTSLMLAVDPSLVRLDHLPRDAAEGRPLGVAGDPRASSAALGQLGVDAVVAGSVAAIRSAVAARR